MKISDQPGRFVAVFVVAPILFFKGKHYKDWFILIFAIVLFLWDLFWILRRPPVETDLKV